MSENPVTKSPNRAVGFKPKAAGALPKPKFIMPSDDKLFKMDEAEFIELTSELKLARNEGNKLKSAQGAITKRMEKLWNGCIKRVGGDINLLEFLSLSDGMLLVYGDAARIDNEFGPGTFLETKSSTSKGASNWRQPWRRIKLRHFPKNRSVKTPSERLMDICIEVFDSKEVSHQEAMNMVNRVWGKK